MKKFQILSHFFFVVGLLFAGCSVLAMEPRENDVSKSVLQFESPEYLANQRMQNIEKELDKKYPPAPSFVLNPIGRAKWEFFNNRWVQGGFRSAIVGIPTTVLMGLICENVGEIPGKKIITKGSFAGGFAWGFSAVEQQDLKRLGLQNKLIGTENFKLTIQNFQTVQKNQTLIEENQNLLKAAVLHRKDICGAMNENFGRVQITMSNGFSLLHKDITNLQREMEGVKLAMNKMNEMMQEGFSDQKEKAEELEKLMKVLQSKQEEISGTQDLILSEIREGFRQNKELGEKNLRVGVGTLKKVGKQDSGVEDLLKDLGGNDFFKKLGDEENKN